MKIELNEWELEKLVSYWNTYYGIENNKQVASKYDLMASYDIKDFGYSKATDSFWCVGTDEDNQKAFQAMLDISDRNDLNPNGLYFTICPYTGKLKSFNNYGDRCCPIDMDELAEEYNYPKDLRYNEDWLAKNIELFKAISIVEQASYFDGYHVED